MTHDIFSLQALFPTIIFEKFYENNEYFVGIQAIKVQMKDFVTSENAQLALIYNQKGKLFRHVEGFKATALQVSKKLYMLVF